MLIPLLFSIACLTLGSLAISGNTTKKRSDTYLFKLNLTEANAASLVGSSVPIQSSSGSTNSSVSQYGLSDIYTFGLWNYCKGTNTNGVYTATYCSKVKAFYQVDIVTALANDLSSHSLTISTKVEDYSKTVKIITKVVFITSIIGLAFSFISFLITVFSFSSHALSCCGMILGTIGLVSMLIAAGSSTGTFMVLKKAFDNDRDTYGWIGTLGNYKFYGFIWGSTGAFLLTNLFNFFAICCGSTKSKSHDKDDEEPFMGFEEKSMAYTESH